MRQSRLVASARIGHHPPTRHLNNSMQNYCSTKFTDLTVHVQSRLLYNCCKAWPERVNLDWLEANPGKLFHTPTMAEDRQIMLDGGRCDSCTHGCYKYEDQGLVSARLRSDPVQITVPDAPLRRLQISLSNDCNLSCAYCGPEWSTGWQRDIIRNGPYEVGESQLNNTNWSRLWDRMKQRQRSTDTRFFQLLLREIELATDLEEVAVLGGEPLLHNQLPEVLTRVQGKRVTIASGLGVSDSRLRQFLKRHRGQNIEFMCSAESTGEAFELLRNGITWPDYQRRVAMISDSGHRIKFGATISNLSLFGLHLFLEQYAPRFSVGLNPVTDRSWLNANVMDEASKQQVTEQLRPWLTMPGMTQYIQSLQNPATEPQRAMLARYVSEFSKRKQQPTAWMPAEFRSWLGI